MNEMLIALSQYPTEVATACYGLLLAPAAVVVVKMIREVK